MIGELEPVWKQFQETYQALRLALAELPEERVNWRPGPAANTVAGIVQHLARGNGVYASMMEQGQPGERWPDEGRPSRGRLLERLAESEQRVQATFERMTSEALRRPRAERWNPLGPEVAGPLDALWFAQQMVRHSAYHLGQVNVYLLLLEGENSQ
jgi:uncharacterized damage-inducible protein DinB